MSRMFRTFTEAEHEIRRELAERSIIVQPETMQDKVVAENMDYLTKEVQNFQYTVTQPRLEDLNPIQPWADAEFQERVLGAVYMQPVNPGNAWEFRKEVWAEFLEHHHEVTMGHPEFSYTYSERLSGQIKRIIDELKLHPNSRQLIASIWDPRIDLARLGRRRVPCSLSYQFLNRQGRLDMTYTMRSCDFITHWSNDVYLARRMQLLISEETGIPAGFFSQIIYSLHVYAKDVANEF